MALTVAKLLLTDARQAQLTAALASSALPDPIGQAVGEANAEIARRTFGYTFSDAEWDHYARTLALHNLYSLVGPVPFDIAKAWDGVQKQLELIEEGKRQNLPRGANIGTGDQGYFGSAPRLSLGSSGYSSDDYGVLP